MKNKKRNKQKTPPRFEGAISRLKSYSKSNDKSKAQERVEKSVFQRHKGNSWNVRIA